MKEKCSNVAYVTPSLELVTLQKDVVATSEGERGEYNMGWFDGVDVGGGQ